MSRIVAIGDVADIHRGSIDPRKYPDSHFELYSIPGFDNRRAPEQLLGADIGSNKNVLPEQGVLFSKLNPRINRVWTFGRTSLAKRIASTEFVCLVPDERRLDLEYLGWRLRVPDIVQELPVAAAAATKSRERIKPRSLLDLPISLPPLHEQRRIVSILDRAARIERLRAQARERLREFVPALFIKMFGDPVENPKGWKICCLDELAQEFRYGTSKKCGEHENDGDLPILRIPNVLGNTINWTNLKFTLLSTIEENALKLDEGDVLFVRTNGNPQYIGRCAVFRDGRPAGYASYLIRMRLRDNGVIPDFVASSLSLPSMRNIILRLARTTAGNYNISIRSLKSIPVPVPPVLLQMRFVSIVETLLSVARAAETASENSRALTDSLLTTLLTGNVAQSRGITRESN